MRNLLFAAIAALVLAGCQADESRDRALVGGGLGSATGAIIGHAASDGGTQETIAGAIIGGATGAIIGGGSTPPPAPPPEPPKECVGYDRNGNPFPIHCPDQHRGEQRRQ